MILPILCFSWLCYWARPWWIMGIFSNFLIYQHKENSATLLAIVPERSQGPQKSQNAKDTQDLSSACRCHGDNNVNDRYKDQDSIQDIPAALQVGVLPREKAKSYHLQPGEERQFIFTWITTMSCSGLCQDSLRAMGWRCNYLNHHFSHKDCSEDVIRNT